MRRTDREIKDFDDILEIIHRGKICHLGLADNNLPYVIAMNYGFTYLNKRLTMYFHSAGSGRKIEMIKKNPLACFMVDIDHRLYKDENESEWTMKYRSVIGTGKIEIIRDITEKKYGMDILMSHYSEKDVFDYNPAVFSAVAVLKLSVSEITGKKNI